MKTNLTLLFLLAFFITFSQEDKSKENLFKKQLDAVADSYRGYENKDSIVIQNKLLDERLAKAFNQVVFGSSDLVNNASAFGVSLNKEKTNVSVNTNFHLLGESKDQLYLKAGINANGSGSVFNLYSGDEWQNSIGGSIGLIWKFSGSGFTNEKTNKLEHNKVLRKLFIRDSIKDEVLKFDIEKYKDIRAKYLAITENESLDSKLDSINIVKLKKYFSELKKAEKFLKNIEQNINESDDYNKKLGSLDFSSYAKGYNENNDSLSKYLLEKLWAGDVTGNNALKDIIEDVAYKYDEKNIKNTGYSFWWLDTNLNLSNNTFNFSEKAENIDNSVLADFDTLVRKKTGINKLSSTFSLNINYSYNSSINGAWYLQGGVKFKSGSFLNSNLINGTAKVSKFKDGLFFLTDEDKKVIGNFGSIGSTLKYGTFDIYGARFFGKKKVFGINLALNHRYSIKTPQNSSYNNNYSVLLGPVFRKPKDDDDTGLTFSLDVGFDNAPYNSRAKDSFVARIRVGIPFKLYNIKK